MKFVGMNINRGHLRIAHLLPFLVVTLVKFAAHFETFAGSRRGDEADNGLIIDQRFASPVHRSEGE